MYQTIQTKLEARATMKGAQTNACLIIRFLIFAYLQKELIMQNSFDTCFLKKIYEMNQIIIDLMYQPILLKLLEEVRYCYNFKMKEYKNNVKISYFNVNFNTSLEQQLTTSCRYRNNGIQEVEVIKESLQLTFVSTSKLHLKTKGISTVE